MTRAAFVAIAFSIVTLGCAQAQVSQPNYPNAGTQRPAYVGQTPPSGTTAPSQKQPGVTSVAGQQAEAPPPKTTPKIWLWSGWGF